MHFQLLENILIVLALAVVGASICRIFSIPVLIGYILVGVAAGPFGGGLIPDNQITRELAEFGIVFLLFTIGLEFSLGQLSAMRRAVFAYGGAQILISVLLTVFVGWSLAIPFNQSLVIGMVVAMSSTAIVIKLLTEQKELNQSHGRDALAILIAQDLAVVPCLIAIPSLVMLKPMALMGSLSLALVKGAVAISLIVILGRYLLRPLFYRIAKSFSLEIFTWFVLLLTLGLAWFTAKLGLSLSLGAFLAGIMLAETEFQYQIEAKIQPFTDVLLGLFFVSIGMQVNLAVVLSAWHWMALLLAALLLFKVILVSSLGLRFANDPISAVRTALVLAQGGEFGIAIIALALQYRILPNDYAQVMLGALLLSMIMTTWIIRYNGVLVRRLFPGLMRRFKEQHRPSARNASGRILICGYGRVGQNTARISDSIGQPFAGVVIDPDRVKQANLVCDKVFYADATHYQNLKAAGIDSAKALLITFHDRGKIVRLLKTIRTHHKNLPIILRCFDDNYRDEFEALGASEVVSEAIEASLQLAARALLTLDKSAEEVTEIIAKTRHNHLQKTIVLQ